MNKYIKSFLISAVIAFIGAIIYAAATSKGVMYSPGITTTEMDALSYTEASTLMQSRAHEVSAYDFLASSIGASWFWLNLVKLWSAMLLVSFVSFLITDKWRNA